MGLGYGSQWGNREGVAEEQRLVGKGEHYGTGMGGAPTGPTGETELGTLT